MSAKGKSSRPEKTTEDTLGAENDALGVTAALQQAGKDIKNDPDLAQKPDAADALDKGELARLEGKQ